MKLYKSGIIFFFIFLLPSFIFSYLSLPRIYFVLTEHSTFTEEFSQSYQTLLLNFTYVLIALFLIIQLFHSASAKLFFVTVLNIMFWIRVFEAGIKLDFGMGFTPVVFAYFDIQTAEIAFRQYGFLFLLLVIVNGFITFLFFKMLNWNYPTTVGKRVLFVFMLFLGIRGGYLLEVEGWHSFEDFASVSMVEQLHDHLQSQRAISALQWEPSEREVLVQKGINLELPELAPFDKMKKKQNLIVVYLESFQSNYTAAGDSPLPGLTPNLDAFIQKNTFVPNFYNSGTPTLNGLISTLCGILPLLSNTALRKNTAYTNRLLCMPDILHEYGYHQIFLTGEDVKFGGLVNFYKMHQYDLVFGKEDIFEKYPEYEKRKMRWGVQSTDMVKVAADFLEMLQQKKPFHLTLFLSNTHVPGFTGPDCPTRNEDRYLESILCVDHAFKNFIEYLQVQAYWENTLMVLVGDHMGFLGSGKSNILTVGRYGKVFLAIRSPQYALPKRLETVSYGPDLAPTILELLGTDIKSLYAGKSMISLRKNYQQLLAPKYELNHGKMIQSNENCPIEQLQKTTLVSKTTPFSPCERQKVITGLKHWVKSLEIATQKIE